MKLCLKTFLLTLVIILISLSSIFSQGLPADKNLFEIQRAPSDVKVDGIIDDAIWGVLTPINNFTQVEPNPGNPSAFKTEVYITYDDYAIYIAAKMYDDQPDKVFNQLSERDGVYNADRFSFMIDPYNTGTNGYLFHVTSANIQSDARLYDGGEDGNWDGVWLSTTNLTEEGWVTEIKIPYSAIRLPDAKEQTWAVNFFRENRRTRETSSWNPINQNVEGRLNQCGIVKGIYNIQTPPRISVSPYTSLVTSKSAIEGSKLKTSFSGGMDLKVGLSDAFTLDATLVPDYSDVRSDDLFYNLSPFEVQYTDYRPFFTEGIDLFNKGGLFYSRRIGSSQPNLSKANIPGTVIKELPTKNRIINASKLSGRTNKGLGIGVFNAIEKASYAIVFDTLEQSEASILVSPLTNYSVIVLDQVLPNNSSIALINTNVLRSGADYDANVTGTSMILRNKPNTYALSANMAFSQKYRNGFSLAKADFGHSIAVELSKTAGIFRFYTTVVEETDTYDPNDLGFLTSNNERQIFGGVSINNETPHGNNIRSIHRLNFIYDQLYKQGSWTNLRFDASSFFLKKSFLGLYFSLVVEPLGSHNYYEPRVLDFKTYYAEPASARIEGLISTSYSKPVAIDFDAQLQMYDQKERYILNLSLNPRLLINDHLSIFPSFDFSYRNNDEGRITTNTLDAGIEGVGENDLLFGKRNVYIFSPNIHAKYIFDEKLSFNFRLYQNWNYLNYSGFGKLESNGTLGETTYQGRSENGISLHNSTVSFFTMDVNLVWRFQPGSSLNLFYNQGRSLFNIQQSELGGYFDNFSQLLDQNSNQTLGLKVLYYLDYATVKKALGKGK